VSRITPIRAGPLTLPNASAVQYTVPASAQAVIRYIRFLGISTVAQWVNASIDVDATTTRLAHGTQVGINTPLELYGPYTMEAGETLRAYAAAASAVNFVAGLDEIMDAAPYTKVSKRFIGPVALGTTAATVYTVPANKIAVLRHIRIHGGTGPTPVFVPQVSIGVDATGVRIMYYELTRQQVIPGQTSFGSIDTQCYIPMTAGEILQASGSAANVITMTIDGEEYSI
jgi:hypothetical protein